MILAGLTSCYKDVPFKGLEQEPKLFFQCLPGVQDTTVLWLRSTFPVNNGLEITEVRNPKFMLKVNGEPVGLEQNNGLSSAFPSDAFFTTVPLRPGDRLEVYGEADGFDLISSSTVIPEKFSDLTYEAKVVPSPNPDYYTAHLGRGASQGISKEVTEFTVTFQDTPDVHDCYMAEVTEYAYYNQTGGNKLYNVGSVAYVLPKERTDFILQPYAKTEFLLVEHSSPWNTVNDFFFRTSRLTCVTDDSSFEGKMHTMKIQVNRMMSSAHELKYRLRLYRLTEDYFKYVKAWKIAENADFAELPSSTPFMAYDNVDGGSGIFAGAQVFDSGIVQPE